MGAIWPLVPARAALARLLLEGGDSAAALEQSELALAEVRAKGCWSWGAEVVLGLADALAALGRAEDAADPVAELAAGLAAVDAPAAQALLPVCQAVIAHAGSLTAGWRGAGGRPAARRGTATIAANRTTV